jgi:hypothetical protein
VTIENRLIRKIKTLKLMRPTEAWIMNAQFFLQSRKRFAFRMKSLSYEIWAMDNFLPEKK